MGAWGTYPKDSDGALDLFGDISNLVNKNFEKIAAGYGGYNYAGAVMILLQSGFYVDRKIVEKAKKYVEEEIKDVTSPSGKSEWKNKSKTIKSMNEVLKGFNEILEDKKAKQIMAPVRWLERNGDRIKKNWSGNGFVD